MVIPHHTLLIYSIMITVKTYKSYTYGPFGITLEKRDGTTRYISFGGGSRYLSHYSTFTTSDKETQELLESSPNFGRYYRLDKVQDIQEQSDIKKEQERFKKVYLKNNTAARAWFKENLPDVAVSYLRNQQAFIDKAKEYGYLIIYENTETTE